MLAKDATEAFNSKDWIFEIKWDGYRAIAETGSRFRMYSRNGNSFAATYPVVSDALSAIKKRAVIDGEIVVLNEEGLPDFQKIQDYERNPGYQICYYAFDILELEGKNLTGLPLLKRKEILKKFLPVNDVIRYSDHIHEDGIEFFNLSAEKHLEGIMAKRVDSTYHVGRRTTDWLKIKNNKTADVIICGYTEPAGARNFFGSLVLGMKDGDTIRHAGNAGTGYDEKKLKSIFNMLQPLRRKTSPISENIKLKGVTWVVPEIVCEVKFTEWTRDGKLRHPVFLRLREDKTTKETDMSSIKPVKAPASKKSAPVKAAPKNKASKRSETKVTKGVTSGKKEKENKETLRFGNIEVPVTNRDKIYFPEDKVTKGMVIEYYQSVADYILPYLKNRPQSLNRNPSGIHASGFYHKDAGEGAPSWVKSFPVESGSSDKIIDYIICNDRATLAYLNNLGCIELNPWHSVMAKPDHPDYIIIDIDPSDNNTFEQVIEAARAFKELLDRAKIDGYCKTSGASGLHIYIPTARKYNYEDAKNFAHLLCMLVQEQLPDFTTLTRNLKKRGSSHIYLDYLQNRKGQTISSVYSLRPKVGATVSMPLEWKEVKKGLTPQDFNIRNTLKRIEKKGDIFKGVLGKGADIIKAIATLGG